MSADKQRYSKAEIEVAARLAAPQIVHLVTRACGRKHPQASPTLGERVVSWEEYVSHILLAALTAAESAKEKA